MREENARRGADLALSRLAARQYGVVSTAQLLALGLNRTATSRRLRAGRLHRLHRGVYAVGHRAVSPEGRWLAAVLACGEGAVLSHRSAAALWELRPPPPGPVDVTVPGDGGRCRREGIRTHRSLLEPEDVSTHRAIPVTTPARTVADLRHRLSSSNLRSVLRQAELRGLDVGSHFALEGTRSELERRFLALCRRHGLPQPQVNVPLDSYVVDFLWPEARLVVETDGYRFHHGRGSFEDDRARDVRLKLLGYEVLRVTWRQIRSDRTTLVATLRRLLRDAGAT